MKGPSPARSAIHVVIGMLAALPLLCGGCAHRKAPITYSTDAADVRGHELRELRLSLSDFGLDRWRMPMNPRRYVTGSPFGPRVDPITGEAGRMHHGQDIGCRIGAPIFAVAAGTVVISERSRSAGRWIVIDHGEWDGHELQTRYLHLSARFVRVGHQVRRGTIIGACGNSGRSTSPHLHFGIYVDGEPVPPVSIQVERPATP